MLLQESEASKNTIEASTSIDVKVIIIHLFVKLTTSSNNVSVVVS